MSISSSAVLTRLNISVWTANKLDREATETVLATNHAKSADAGQFRKNLMSGSRARKDIADYAAQCRLWHNEWTLGWEDRGARLLPTSLFMDYKAQANMRRTTFEQMVANFLVDYPQLKQVAQNYLGTLFNPDDYPCTEEIRSKFGFQLVLSPVPESGHFILDVPAQELEETKESFEHEITSRVADAMQGAWERLHKMLVGMSDKLTDSDEETRKRWHDTFVTNAQQLCRMLSHLNVTNDPKLEQARRELEQVMVGANIDQIKDSPVVREQMKTKVDAILKQFDW